MRRFHNRTVCLLVAIMFSVVTEASDCFRLSAVQNVDKTQQVGQRFSADRGIKLDLRNESVNGLSMDGSITKLSDDYFVRVILKDTQGKEYIVLESYDEINDSSTISFHDYCEETALLENINADSLFVILKSAVLNMDIISYSSIKRSDADFKKEQARIRKAQVQTIAEKINTYNVKHKKLWRAGVTSMSLCSYETKKRVLNFTDTTPLYGYEYYAGGIFEMGKFNHKDELSTSNRVSSPTSPYIDHFDWRNRHGKNWMTSIKTQGWSSYCTFFSTAGCIEAIANLYYNLQLDLDLSEQEMASCHQHHLVEYYHNYDPFNYGHQIEEGFEYVEEHGVCNEGAYPFVNNSNQVCLSGQIEPDTIVSISGHIEHIRNNEDSIKKAIINKGPLVCGHMYTPYYHLLDTIYHDNSTGHAMTLVGYGTIHEGDTISMNDSTGNFFVDSLYVIPANDNRIGMTYWIFKNSWGGTPDDRVKGYMYLLIYDKTKYMYDGYSVKVPITIKDANGNDYYTDSDIVIEDRDGDGLYFWGIGTKPAHCPSWVPEAQDGDDSDINLGEMNEYGHLDTLSAGITIKTPVTYSSNNTTSYRLGIVNGGTLTITETTTLTGSGHIRVCEGGTLIVDGGTINNADITLVPGCTVIIRNNGKINMAYGKSFEAPKGAIVQIDQGEINNY